MEAKCLVLLPKDYRKDGDRIVPIGRDFWAFFDADVVLAIDESGSTTVVKNRWGDCGRIVLGEWTEAAKEGRVWCLFNKQGFSGVSISRDKLQQMVDEGFAGEEPYILPYDCE